MCVGRVTRPDISPRASRFSQADDELAEENGRAVSVRSPTAAARNRIFTVRSIFILGSALTKVHAADFLSCVRPPAGMKPTFFLPLLLFTLVVLTVPVRCAEIAAPVRWQVVRNPAPAASTGFSDDAQQQIAGHLGTGHFLVTDHRLAPPGERSPLRLLFFFESNRDKTEAKPKGRVLLLPNGAPRWFESTEDAVLFTEAARLADLEKWNDATMTTALPELVGAALYGGNVRSVTATPGRAFQSSGAWTWHGRFVLTEGLREDVTLVRRPGANPEFEVQRVAVPSETDTPAVAAGAANGPSVEQWAVTEAPKWRLRQRYQLGLALANLRGDARRKYQIGSELLLESDPGAKSLGLRLVKEAANAGYTDAINLLATLESGPRRPESDRDRERPER